MTDSSINRMAIILTMFMLVISANIPIDIHVPAMPIIVHQLSVSVSEVQLTMGVYFLSYGTFPLIYGALSDAFGRKKLVCTALVIVALGSLTCTLAENGAVLLIGRFIQGIGSAGCTCMSRSIMRDSYTGSNMARVASLMGVAIEMTLAFSPVIGGYLVTTFGWHSNFVFVIILPLLVLIFVYFIFSETSLHHHKDAIKLKTLITNGKDVFKNRIFQRYVWGSAAAFSSAAGYFTISPFVIQNDLHYSAQAYGLFTLCVTGAVVIGSFINALLVKRMGYDAMIALGLALLFISGAVLLLVSEFMSISLASFIGISALAFGGLAFLFGNCMSGGLRPFDKNAGVASSIYTVVQILSGFVVTSLIGIFSGDSSEFMAAVFIAMSAFAGWKFLANRPRELC
jgi:Bcr/CflA subfamily drug resistance transporter